MKNTRKFIGVVLAMLMVVALLASCAPAAQEPTPAPAPRPAAAPAQAPAPAPTPEPEEIEITFAIFTAPGTIENIAAGMFKEKVETQSDGRITVEIFSGATLGGERDNIEQIKAGVIQMTILGDILPNLLAPDRNVTVIPFIFPDMDSVFAAWDGNLGNMLRESIEGQGLTVLGKQLRGARNLTSNIPINSPEDLKGLKLRVPEIPAWIRVWSQFGTLPTPIAFPEVYSALQLGVVDAQENPYGTIIAGKFYEVQDYLIHTNHLYGVFHWTGNKEFFDELSPEDRELVMTAINQSVEWANQETNATLADMLQQLKDEGMKVIEVDAAAFRRLALPAIQEIAKGWAPGVYEEIKEFLE